jgi:hypothetical protein
LVYAMHFTWEYIVILLKCLYYTSVKEDSYFESHDANMHACLKLLVLLDYCCLQTKLEKHMSNPSFCDTGELPEACGMHACMYCTGKYAS